MSHSPARNNGTAPAAPIDFDLLRRIAGRNFRDLGGHPTTHGRRVKSATIYRSAHITALPDGHPIATLALRTVITLQSRLEVNHLGPPHPEVLKSARWVHIPMGDRWFEQNGLIPLSREPGQEHLVLVTKFREGWWRLFKLLAEPGGYPALLHCSAGRDRTGVAAAMLLELLSVSRARIIEDFLASNAVFRQLPLRAEQLRPIFAEIDRRGGIRPFMRQFIGLEQVELDAIHGNLLED